MDNPPAPDTWVADTYCADTCFFGNTEIERIRKQGEKTIRHDWIIFDAVDEAMAFFNDRCGEFLGYYA
jgi:hypothetical protein